MICGIDPGAKGAIALLDGTFAEIHDMPMLGKNVESLFDEMKSKI